MGGAEAGGGPDFMIHGLYSFTFMGQELWTTTTAVGMGIVTLLLILLAFFAGRKLKAGTAVPEGVQNGVEYGAELLERMTSGVMGDRGDRFFNYVGTVFLFILLCNVAGLLGLRAPTADFGVTLALGIFTFVIVHYQGIRNRGMGHFASMFRPFPVLFPINLIGEIANPLSLSLRLFGNMVSGVILIELWYGMMPLWAKIGLPAFLHGYCDLFSGAIQAYVFCMLTLVYVNDKMEPY